MINRKQLNLILGFVLLATLIFRSSIQISAYTHIVNLPVPYGIVNGYTTTFDPQVDNVYTSGSSSYTYPTISIGGRVWGKCSPDMTGCTPNQWKIKDQRYNTRYWSTTTSVEKINSRGLHGIGVARHYVSTYSSGVIRYTSEHGTSYTNGANSSCYYNGPSLHADTLTGLPCP